MTNLILSLKTIFYLLTKAPSFIIRIENNKVSVVKGPVKKSFLADCSEIVQQNGIQSGIVYAADGQYGKMTIYSSNEIPKEVLQQLRNSWSFSL